MRLRNSSHRTRLACLLSSAGLLTGLFPAQAQPTLVSSDPIIGATGVSTTTTVVFTFSAAMDTDTNVTYANLFDLGSGFIYATTPSWSAGNTVLTCAPVDPFSANKTIYWAVEGQNPNGDALEGNTFGYFTTGTGGSGTNATTTFSVGKVHHYNQTSAGSPTLDPVSPYGFAGVTSLSSNRTATSVALTLPTGSVSNLTHLPPPQAEIFIMSPFTTSLSAFDATFPEGNYGFFVQAASSNQTVVVYLPPTANLPQPGAPHLTNFPAAQVVNLNQTFVLGWDAFPGGTAADYIDVDVGLAYGSPNPGLPGALTGTARTFTIPAGTLQPNTTYDSRVGFFRFAGSTNANYATAAFRATYTEFSLITTGGAQLLLTNATYAPANFSFDVLCSTGQTVTVEYRTNLTAGQWNTLLTTNSPAVVFGQSLRRQPRIVSSSSAHGPGPRTPALGTIPVACHFRTAAMSKMGCTDSTATPRPGA